MRSVSRDGWLETSQAEAHLARAIATLIAGRHSEASQRLKVLELIAFELAFEKNDSGVDPAVTATVAEIFRTYPALLETDVARHFPEHNEDLTTNLLGRLAYEISKSVVDPNLSGAVGTPSILASDMVEVAAAIWLSPKVNRPITEILSLLIGQNSSAEQLRKQVVPHLEAIKWYDPCVGGGVFPLAILQLLSRMGVGLEPTALAKVMGRDNDPFAVIATRLRVALLVSLSTGKSLASILGGLETQFEIEDSLHKLAEQQNLLEEVSSDGHSGVDIVVGNPPYVRADRLSPSTKNYLKQAFPTIANGTADLYTYFIAHGLIALNTNGVLCFVSPASFQKSRYGAQVRQYISHHGSLCALFDFDELPIFDGVGVHASVYAIRKAHADVAVMTYSFQSLPKEHPLHHGISHATPSQMYATGRYGWQPHQPQAYEILRLLEEAATPLQHSVGGILSGIKTGSKRAFFVSAAEAARIRAEPYSSQFVRPLLRPTGIRAWRSEWDGTHILLVKQGEILDGNSLVYQHLRGFEAELRQRTDTKGHATWYGLRACNYYDSFEQPKIVFPDIASNCRFAVDNDGYFIPDGAFIIPRADYFLVALLNSSVGRFYFRLKCNSIGNPEHGGRLRFKKTYVENFPVPDALPEQTALREQIYQRARAISSNSAQRQLSEELDALILQLYRIPPPLHPIFRN